MFFLLDPPPSHQVLTGSADVSSAPSAPTHPRSPKPSQRKRPENRRDESSKAFLCGLPISCGVTSPNPHALTGAATSRSRLRQQWANGLEFRNIRTCGQKCPHHFRTIRRLRQVGPLRRNWPGCTSKALPPPSHQALTGSADVSSAPSAPTHTPFPQASPLPPVPQVMWALLPATVRPNAPRPPQLHPNKKHNNHSSLNL